MDNIITELEFASSLFANMKINNIHEFRIDKLHEVIVEEFKSDDIRLLFLDLDYNLIVSTGLSHFQIIGGICQNLSFHNPRAKITFNKEVANELLNSNNEVTNEVTMQIVSEYIKTNGFSKKLNI